MSNRNWQKDGRIKGVKLALLPRARKWLRRFRVKNEINKSAKNYKKQQRLFNLFSISSGGGFVFSVDFARPVSKQRTNQIKE